VQDARVTVVIRPQIAAESAEESKDASLSAMINADRQTIITSLNLHMILNEVQISAKSPPGFTICEMVHESNLAFLRQNAAADDETDDNPSLSLCREASDRPLTAAGSVFVHTVLDALMVMTIFNPHILSLYEALLGIGMRGSIHVSNRERRGSLGSMFEEPEAATDTFDEEDPDASTDADSSPIRAPGCIEKSANTDTCFIGRMYCPEGYSSKSTIRTTRDESPPLQETWSHGPGKGFVDKVDVPSSCVGKPFKSLFHDLIEVYGALPVAIYRLSDCPSGLPRVIAVPDPNEPMRRSDEIFIIKNSAPTHLRQQNE
jgi:hypothetical protein